MLKEKTVYFFTDTTDTSFIYNDIFNFAASYQKVVVYTFKSGNKSVFPSNVEINISDFSTYSTRAILSKHWVLVLQLALKEFLLFPNYIFNLKLFAQAVSALMRNIYLADGLIKSGVARSKQAVFFTFWFNGWATALAILKRKQKIAAFYSRIHGTDLYEYRVPVIKRISFRWFQLKYVAHLFSVSETGAAYMKNKYPGHSQKISVNYLGVSGYAFTSIEQSPVFTIVSCSIMDVIKRVYLIPEVLKHLPFPVRWIHIGEKVQSDPTAERFEKNLKELLKERDQVKVELKGVLSNKEVFALYQTTPVNLFMSLSESEGLPVSMMESIGFGIPVLATDVGGCNEIVTASTGILVEKEVDAMKVASMISDFRNSELNTDRMRHAIHEFCIKNFDRDKNFLKLTAQLN